MGLGGCSARLRRGVRDGASILSVCGWVLYDHRDDLKEWTNLTGKAGMDSIRKEMEESLDGGLQNPVRHAGSSP